MEATVSAQCNLCGGSGLYVGMAERHGDAVVCGQCKGTGLYTIKYIPFNGRKEPRSRVLRVLQANPGIISAPGVTSGGVTLAEWVADPSSAKQRGKEMRSHTCPKWWYQSVDYSKGPEWKECDESLGRTFSRCPSFARKSECWARFDREAK
jgi:hypothetical protein